MRKGRKIERQPPPITGCGFLDGIMPETLHLNNNDSPAFLVRKIEVV